MGRKIWLPMHSRKFGSHVTVRPPVRPHHSIPMLHNSINRYGNLNATRGFFWREIARPPGLLERKKLQQSLVCLMSTLTWITEKELDRVIKNKVDEFCWKENVKIS